MNYIGSKQKLSNFIFDSIEKTIAKNLCDCVFCDMFAGSGAVGKVFKSKVKKLISNDLEYYSFVLNRNSIGNFESLHVKLKLLEGLSLTPSKEGFIFQNYSQKSGRCYFSDENAKQIDGFRQEIERLKSSNLIDEQSFYFLLASLLESSDKVANTASVYASYLKHLKSLASKKMTLEPALFEECEGEFEVYNEDANALIQKIEGDILYLDPPYNKREYGLNYHLLDTIALYDTFEPKGKGGLRAYTRSDYCKSPKALKALESLIKEARFEYIFLSYNDEGLLGSEEIKNMMQKYGKYACITKNYRRFATNDKHKKSHTQEFLHVLKK